MAVPSPENASPAMAQWFTLKAQEPDALLFFRMGDFYELFFGDAQVASMALDIALTKRGTHNGAPIPMCGVPMGAAQTYLSRLIKRGFRVAVAEQLEQPRKGQKGPLKREIIRLVTPGTLTEDELLEAGRANFLLALAQGGRRRNCLGAAWVDVSTGHVETLSLPRAELAELLARLDPSEILLDPALETKDLPLRPGAATIRAPARLTPERARTRMAAAYKVAQLDALGEFSDEEATACALLLDYVRRSQAGQLPRLQRPLPTGQAGVMGLDPATRQSLEILQARDGTETHTLLSTVAHTVTAAGTRLLARWLSTPSTDPALIAARQDAWSWLGSEARSQAGLAQDLRQLLRSVPDCARALGRISTGRALPRDLAAVRDTLHLADLLTEKLAPYRTSAMPGAIRQLGAALYGRADSLLERLTAALAPTLPARLEDGGVIAAGFDPELDRLRSLRDDSRRVIARLQAELVGKYSINTLRIRHHSQLGYVIEVPASHGARLKERPELHYRQGTASLARFSSEELSQLDRTIAEASEQAATLERHLFETLAGHVLDTPALDEITAALAELDVYLACEKLAASGRWCRPKVTEDTRFTLRACRHPVVEAALEHQGGGRFMPNSCTLPPAHYVMLLTGPNMAGKSTFLRQTALAVILAQAGFPVPAEGAEIGVVDRLFSRVGAADDLARGRSTFMVEMTETAAILNQAGPRSLVVVDEIGRGTSTLDGLSIAWATLEALHSQLGARTIFATHFHELGALLGRLPHLTAATMSVREWEGEVVFQHEVKPGLAGRSWGLHVARLAGLPAAVLKRARRLLAHFEQERGGAGAVGVQPLPLFTAGLQAEPQLPDAAPPQAAAEDPRHEILEAFLADLDPDCLTPRQAHEALYRLQERLKGHLGNSPERNS
ncbi:DNA mismatch repair protein MutS [Oecophyllibacter saccharovorans]|uniref:DNA mismatch repair protein MutS n=1 Tax=Oecophyllibacter saccharovorans TaxID=2558360 RepID=UPI00116C3A02|nr:DNA mismatch repair protein MutS [Oecophyllibacter saccharovorans]TPW36871.1 DNA mismatch repair protein MutS [Oecophyllibacter saccharovorans]